MNPLKALGVCIFAFLAFEFVLILLVQSLVGKVGSWEEDGRHITTLALLCTAALYLILI